MRQYLMVLFFLFFCVGATAAELKNSVRVTREPHKRQPAIKIRYKQTPAAVQLDSVCDNYAYGSIDYRHCRDEARVLFRAKCEQATADFYASRNYDHARRMERDKWCDAGGRFQP